MKDYEIEMLTAFFAALTQYPKPLSKDFVIQLNQLSEALDLKKLRQLIKDNAELEELYQTDYKLLSSITNFRNLGLATTPNHEAEVNETTSHEIDNTASQIAQDESKKMESLQQQIQGKLHEEQPESLIEKIFGDPNPVQATKEAFLIDYPIIY